jgi:hypothetical protein
MAEVRVFSSVRCLDCLWSPLSFLFSGYRGTSHSGKQIVDSRIVMFYVNFLSLTIRTSSHENLCGGNGTDATLCMMVKYFEVTELEIYVVFC